MVSTRLALARLARRSSSVCGADLNRWGRDSPLASRPRQLAPARLLGQLLVPPADRRCRKLRERRPAERRPEQGVGLPHGVLGRSAVPGQPIKVGIEGIGRFGLISDTVYANLEDNAATSQDRLKVDATANMLLQSLAGTYRVGTWQLADFGTTGPLALTVDPYAGIRYTYLDTELQGELDLPDLGISARRTAEEVKHWVDPIVGVRTAWTLGERWSLVLAGDVAGSAPATSTAPRRSASWIPVRAVRREQRQPARRLPGAEAEIRGRRRPQRLRVGHDHPRPDRGPEDHLLIDGSAPRRYISGRMWTGEATMKRLMFAFRSAARTATSDTGHGTASKGRPGYTGAADATTTVDQGAVCPNPPAPALPAA